MAVTWLLLNNRRFLLGFVYNHYAYLATGGPNFAAEVVRGVVPAKSNEAELFQLCWRIAHRAISRSIPSGMLKLLLQN